MLVVVYLYGYAYLSRSIIVHVCPSLRARLCGDVIVCLFVWLVVCIFICMDVCLFVCVCICMCMPHVSICVWIDEYMGVCVYVSRLFTCMVDRYQSVR